MLAYTLLLLTLPPCCFREDIEAVAVVVVVVGDDESHMQYRTLGRLYTLELAGLMNVSDMQQLQLQVQLRQHSKYRENKFFNVLSYESKTPVLVLVSCKSPTVPGSSISPAARIVYLSRISKQYWYNDKNSKISASSALEGTTLA
jgi:hypothetical protein